MRNTYLRYIQEHHLLLPFSHVWGAGVGVCGAKKVSKINNFKGKVSNINIFK